MSVLLSTSFKPIQANENLTKCFISQRGGVDITVSGNSGTISLYKKINGVSVPIVIDEPIACKPPTRICEIIGSNVEFCIQVKDVAVGDCIQLSVVDVHATIISSSFKVEVSSTVPLIDEVISCESKTEPYVFAANEIVDLTRISSLTTDVFVIDLTFLNEAATDKYMYYSIDAQNPNKYIETGGFFSHWEQLIGYVKLSATSVRVTIDYSSETSLNQPDLIRPCVQPYTGAQIDASSAVFRDYYNALADGETQPTFGTTWNVITYSCNVESCTEFFRTFVLDKDQVITIIDTDIDGNPYTAQGLVRTCCDKCY